MQTRTTIAVRPSTEYINKFGRNTDIDIAAEEDVWDGGGTWVAPTTARTHDITSSDTNDTSAGTGAQTIRIFGLDANGEEQQEDVTMNGTSNVATANTYIMIHRMQVLTAGSGNENAGNITATAQTDATVTAQINAGNNQTLMAIYQVPAGRAQAYLRRFYVAINGAVNGQYTAFLRIMDNDNIWKVKRVIGGASLGSSLVQYDFQDTPLPVSALSTVKISASVSADNSDISAGFDLSLRMDIQK